ncbi:DNA helicase [Tanacetum coccineum]
MLKVSYSSAPGSVLMTRKLVAKSSPFTKDDNHASFDVGYHVYEADSTISSKKQCLGGSNFISSPVTNVTSSGIWDITTISGTAVLNINFGQPIATLHRSNVVPDTVESQKRSHSVIPTSTNNEPMDVTKPNINAPHGAENYPLVVAMPTQPEYAISNSNNHGRSNRSRINHNRPLTGDTSTQQPSSSNPPLSNNHTRGRRSRTNDNRPVTGDNSTQETSSSDYPLEYKHVGNCDRHFLDNIRAYNQMFSMTSLGANSDESINNGRGPYVFKISGQLYHWIGSLCPTDGEPPRFLQLYIYDTDNEVDNRLSNNSILRRDIVEGLIELLDTHNALVQLFRTAREKLQDNYVLNFKVRLYNVVAVKEYELHTRDMLGAIVYETGPESNMDYDIVLEQRGPRYMYSHYLDALAICRVHENPSYFITFTCNVKWPEISDYMTQFPLLTTTDMADIVDRVFEMKIHEFVNYLRDAQPFGKVVAVLYTIEFQKRGLSHCYTLLCIDESVRVRRDENIDTYVSAELPSQDVDPQGVPYNKQLLLAFYAHINVEYYAWTMLIKYLFKYISKGTDRIVTRISKSNSSSVNNDTAASTSRPYVVVDEIKNYLDARYVSPHEACWRIFEFEIHYQEPAVQLLAVHLQNMQRIVFREGDHLDSVVLNSHKKKTTLTEWLTKSSIGRLAYVHPAAGDLFYQRMLLCHQKGCTSFPGILTLEEAALTATPAELQALLAYIFVYCEVSDPKKLWERTWKMMSEDIPYVSSISLNLPGLHIDDPDLEDYTLYEFEGCLNHCSKSVTDIGLRLPPKHLMYEQKIVLAVASSGIASLLLPASRTAHSRFKIPLELTDTSVCAIKKNTQLADLLKETCLIVWDESPMNDRRCFETLDRTLRDILNQPDHFFGGKTVMLGGDFRQTLPVKKGASRDEIIKSSIANSYLWAHFKIYHLTENMRLNNNNLTEIEKQRRSTFAQWLLDIGNGQIGTPDDSDPDNTSWVDIPDEYCIPNDNDGLTSLINFIYDNDTLHHPSAEKLQEKAIICPKNDTADTINDKILSLLTTTTRTYLSYDEAIPHTHDGGEIELLYPKEYLNSLSFPNLPPHNLTLKVGAPIMLLRNINIAGGLCNGTRLIVTQLLPKVIEARIITESSSRLMATTNYPDTAAAAKGKMVAIEPEISHVISLKPTDYNKTIEVIVYRKWVSEHVVTRQPIKFCCMLIDKQGTAIQANMDAQDTEHFDRVLELGSAYRITDYIGYIQGVSILRTSGNATGNRTQRRMIDIENLNGNIIRLTLWHEKALTFNKQEYEAMEKPVIIAVIPSHPIPTCKNHGPQPTPTYRAIIGDGSGTISLACFSKQANCLVKDINELLAETPDRNPYHLPAALKELEDTNHIFQFHFDVNSTSNRKVFVLDTVFKETVPLLPAPPIAPEPLPEQMVFPETMVTPPVGPVPTFPLSSEPPQTPPNLSPTEPEPIPIPMNAPTNPALSTTVSNEPQSIVPDIQKPTHPKTTPPGNQNLIEPSKEPKRKNPTESSTRRALFMNNQELEPTEDTKKRKHEDNTKPEP